MFTSNGDWYFTDPLFGFPKAFDDLDKAPVQGVYRVAKDGTVTPVIHNIKAPSGIALSPDEKILYVSDVDPKRAAWLAYDVKADGTVTNGRCASTRLAGVTIRFSARTGSRWSGKGTSLAYDRVG